MKSTGSQGPRDFEPHERLKADTWPLGASQESLLLLMNNALVPWLILVPMTRELELHRLEPERRRRIRDEMDLVCDFLEREYRPHKLNIATLGNLVPQLHIHLICRYRQDVYWPAPVWGRQERRDYQTEEVEHLLERVRQELGQTFGS
ncbi:HIT domain-containing protein [Thiocystis violacea]|uniref:HIT domain-containing protein n=1 Tax=Thiocystis violacea TaxID=13725 RepID=UPI0019063FF9|nr:HIT family protein [Thiocystis violacea]MBK1719505.1 HIT family protein [Thiocystis violacea]